MFDKFQFERIGYFIVDPDSTEDIVSNAIFEDRSNCYYNLFLFKVGADNYSYFLIILFIMYLKPSHYYFS